MKTRMTCTSPNGVTHYGHQWTATPIYYRCERCGEFKRVPQRSRPALGPRLIGGRA